MNFGDELNKEGGCLTWGPKRVSCSSEPHHHVSLWYTGAVCRYGSEGQDDDVHWIKNREKSLRWPPHMETSPREKHTRSEG